MADTETNIFLARVAEQAERFEDMVKYLGDVLPLFSTSRLVRSPLMSAT